MSGEDEGRMGVLCLGASAGGLRSLEAVLAKLPASFPWPILVSQHLQREHPSQMAEILSRATSLEVREAKDGETPAAGVVYTCPSAAELGLGIDGRLTLREPAEGRPQRIDHLFSTAAFARPGLVVAVVLSGTGSDGAAGSLVVKLNGGTVIAESEESAQRSGMPRAATKAGTVDATRTADEIAPLVVQLAEGGLIEMTRAMERDVAAIAKTLADASGTDFTRYRTATLRRRIEKRRALLGVPTTQAYHDIVSRDARERDALTKSLLLPVTEFFRDPPAWQALASEVVPALVERARAGRTVRVWCAGCASGEEAYTMAILLAEGGAPAERVQILATDLDADSIRLATAGTYDLARLQNVDAARRAAFFEPQGDALRVREDIRRVVEFRVHDLTRDPPLPGPFDVVICRNVLIYFDEGLQKQVFGSLESVMAPSGIIFLGRSTAILGSSDAFEPVVRAMRIFRSRRQAREGDEPGPSPPPERAAALPGGAVGRRIDAVLVNDSQATIVVIDASWTITLENHGARGASSGSVVGKALLDVFPRWQGSPVHDAIRDTLSTGRSVRVRGVPMGSGYVDLAIEAVSHGADRAVILVATPGATRSTGRADEELIREDLSATNDELQTANEELAAANEELQATNEELASLNEEFLSTNQNLASTNAEMEATAGHARPSAEILHASLLRGPTALVACDAFRRVTLVTPNAAALLGIDAARATGKPLDAAMLGLSAADLDEWLQAALSASGSIDRNIAAATGPLGLTIEALARQDGTKLGWLLVLEHPDPNMRVGLQ